MQDLKSYSQISEVERRLDSQRNKSRTSQLKVTQEYQDLIDKYSSTFAEKSKQIPMIHYTKSDIYQRFSDRLSQRSQTPKLRFCAQFDKQSYDKENSFLATSRERPSIFQVKQNIQSSPVKQTISIEPKITPRTMQKKEEYEGIKLDKFKNQMEQTLPRDKLVELCGIVSRMDVREFKQLPAQ